MSEPVTFYTVKLERHQDLREVFGGESIVTAQAAYEVFAYLEHFDREHFVAGMLDTQRRLIGLHTASIGSLDHTVMSPRELFSVLILAKAHAWLIAHNHPSGEITPSSNDTRCTEQLAGLSSIMGIPLVDHIIVGECGAFYSYQHSKPHALAPAVSVGSRTTRPKMRKEVVKRRMPPRAQG